MKQLFHISNDHSTAHQQVLSIRLGEGHAGFAVTNKNANELYELAYAATDEWNEYTLTGWYEQYPALNKSYNDTLIAFDFPQATMLPGNGVQPGDPVALLRAAGFPAQASDTALDPVAAWQSATLYSTPPHLRGLLTKKWPSASFQHQYSLGLKTLANAGGDDRILVDFRAKDFAIVAIKGNKFILAQSFEYSTPADVLYALLHICQQFSLSQQDVELLVSGLIDRDSALYKELYQYFVAVSFRGADWTGNAEHPAHFFTSFNDLAKCAS